MQYNLNSKTIEYDESYERDGAVLNVITKLTPLERAKFKHEMSFERDIVRYIFN